MSHRTMKLRRPVRPLVSRLRLVALEDRLTPAVAMFGVDAQHSGISAVASQPIQAVHWKATVDDFFSQSFGHYGAALATDANTIIYPHKTAVDPPGFHVVARNGNDGAQVWDVATDWVPSTFNWFPPYQPVLATATNRVYFAGKGGTLYYRTDPDSATGTVTQVAFYGTVTQYLANKATYDGSVYVDTPLMADSQGNIFFGFRVTGSNPAGLVSGIARIAPDGTGTYVSARTAANGDTSIDQAARYSAPALSSDGSTLYLGVRSNSTASYGRLVALNSTTLATQFVSGVLKDPVSNQNASLLTDSTASPMIAPDGTVFYGVMGNPFNGSRGWLLHLSANLGTVYTPGGFGWDSTPSIVPTSMVPGYTGSSPYLIFSKYNNYYMGGGDGADGSNMVAILDPYATEPEFHPSSGGMPVMKRIMFKVGPTPDSSYPNVPTAFREWCVNFATVDPATDSVIVNSEDGKYYRWYLPTNTLTESVTLTGGIGQPYTSTVIAMDGTMFGIADGIMFSIGKTPGLSVSDVTVANNGTSAVFTVALDYPRTSAITVNYATADGSAVAGVNYTATSGMLTFNAGQTSKTVTVTVAPGSVSGGSATFFLNLTSPTNADLLDAQGVATLQGQPPQVQNFSVNDGSAQRSRVSSLTVTFNTQVDFAGAVANAFVLTRNGGTAVSFAATADLVGGVTVVTLNTFGGSETQSGSLADGRYTLTANALQISSGGQFLNGGTNVTFGDAQGLFRYFGDVNGDRRIDIADFGMFSAAYNKTSSDPAFNPIFDFNSDGRIDIADFGQFSVRYFTTLP